MITVEDYKKALGDETENLSEEEILEARRIQNDLAEIFFVMWRKERAEQIKRLAYTKEICEQIQTDVTLAVV